MNSDSIPTPQDDVTPVTGPFAISVHATQSGVDLDVSAYLEVLLLGLAEAAADDPESLIDSLTELADAHRTATAPGTDAERGRARRERDELAESLLNRHVGGGRIPVYGQQVVRLTERLWHLIRPRPVPQQRDAAESGEAAA